MVDQETPHHRIKERSHLNLFLTFVNDSVSDTGDSTGTANSEMADERIEKSQALLLQTFPNDVLHLETSYMSNCRTMFSRISFHHEVYCTKETTPTLTVMQQEFYFHPLFGYSYIQGAYCNYWKSLHSKFPIDQVSVWHSRQ